MKKNSLLIVFMIFMVLPILSYSNVRLKDLARVEQTRDIALIGYGIVVGLSGTGDSPSNRMTLNSIQNTLTRFGLSLDEADIRSRNVASVMITSELPPYSEVGDRVDVTVSSIGDARSLAGGTLMLAPLYSTNDKLYAFAQGQLTVGGYELEKDNNLVRKNFSTVGKVAGGATIERAVKHDSLVGDEIIVILRDPDYTTAMRIVDVIGKNIGAQVQAIHPGKVKVKFPSSVNLMRSVSQIEGLYVSPDIESRVVVNERTGTIVSGADVSIGAVSIAHSNLKIEIQTDYLVSQPQASILSGNGVRSVVVPDTNIEVTEENGKYKVIKKETTVADLVATLNEIDVSTRDIITILQSIKAAGALHAELIIQ